MLNLPQRQEGRVGNRLAMVARAPGARRDARMATRQIAGHLDVPARGGPPCRSDDDSILEARGRASSCRPTKIQESLAPLANRRQRDAELPGNGSARRASGARQNDAGTQVQSVRHGCGARPRFQLFSLFVGEPERGEFAAKRHGSFRWSSGTAVQCERTKGTLHWVGAVKRPASGAAAIVLMPLNAGAHAHRLPVASTGS